MLENTGGMDTGLTANLCVQISLNVDVDRLPRSDIPLNRKPLRIQCHALRRNHIFFLPVAGPGAENQRPDTIDIAEPEYSVSGYHDNRSVTTATALVDAFNRREDVFRPWLNLFLL